MFRSATAALLISAALLAGCSREPKHESRLYSAGEKAEVDGLSYSVIDSQIYQQLGDDPTTARMPQTRFITVQVSVLNAGSEEASIPGMTLVDDSGQTYNELPDGAGVHNWLGMSRKVAPNQTETGMILFDAPAKHYRLRLTDEFSAEEVAIDIPLSFIHERINSATPGVTDDSSAAPKN
ncbi:MAG TPA: DUF4352 domain-containing protein [Bryobacteraceae bacterium]|nr:DUF4352 domain-containing protein [Bryobacteraceae bacterium]